MTNRIIFATIALLLQGCATRLAVQQGLEPGAPERPALLFQNHAIEPAGDDHPLGSEHLGA